MHRGELATVPIVIPDADLVFVEDAEPTYYKLGATLTQPIYTSGKIAAGIRLAELDRAAAGTELDRQRRTTRRETARAYHGAVLAGRSLPLLEAMRAAYADIVADRRASFDEGTVTRQAVLEARGVARFPRGEDRRCPGSPVERPRGAGGAHRSRGRGHRSRRRVPRHMPRPRRGRPAGRWRLRARPTSCPRARASSRQARSGTSSARAPRSVPTWRSRSPAASRASAPRSSAPTGPTRGTGAWW